MGQADDLRQLVPVMRELGVTEAYGVKLGPDPGVRTAERRPRTQEELTALAREKRRATYRVEFGARVDDDKFLDSLP